jgi:hypothetical protein
MKMKKILIGLFFCGIFCSFSQELTPEGTKYTVIATLKKDYDHSCDCQSLIISSNIFEFKIIKINFEEYLLSEINMIIPCPESYGEFFFEKGNTYKIDFYDNECVDRKDGWVCDFLIPKRKKMRRRFWIHSISKIER